MRSTGFFGRFTSEPLCLAMRHPRSTLNQLQITSTDAIRSDRVACGALRAPTYRTSPSTLSCNHMTRSSIVRRVRPRQARLQCVPGKSELGISLRARWRGEAQYGTTGHLDRNLDCIQHLLAQRPVGEGGWGQCVSCVCVRGNLYTLGTTWMHGCARGL